MAETSAAVASDLKSAAPETPHPIRAREDLDEMSPAKARREDQEGRITPLDELAQQTKPVHGVYGEALMFGHVKSI